MRKNSKLSRKISFKFSGNNDDLKPSPTRDAVAVVARSWLQRAARARQTQKAVPKLFSKWTGEDLDRLKIFYYMLLT